MSAYSVDVSLDISTEYFDMEISTEYLKAAVLSISKIPHLDFWAEYNVIKI